MGVVFLPWTVPQVLKDPENLSDAGISDESFVVVMVSKVLWSFL